MRASIYEKGEKGFMKGNKAIIVKVAIGILVVCGIFLGISLFAVGDGVFNRVTRWQWQGKVLK